MSAAFERALEAERLAARAERLLRRPGALIEVKGLGYVVRFGPRRAAMVADLDLDLAAAHLPGLDHHQPALRRVGEGVLQQVGQDGAQASAVGPQAGQGPGLGDDDADPAGVGLAAQLQDHVLDRVVQVLLAQVQVGDMISYSARAVSAGSLRAPRLRFG